MVLKGRQSSLRRGSRTSIETLLYWRFGGGWHGVILQKMLLEQKLIESLGELGTVIESAFEYKTYLALLNNSANTKNLEIIVKDSGQLSSSSLSDCGHVVL